MNEANLTSADGGAGPLGATMGCSGSPSPRTGHNGRPILSVRAGGLSKLEKTRNGKPPRSAKTIIRNIPARARYTGARD